MTDQQTIADLADKLKSAHTVIRVQEQQLTEAKRQVEEANRRENDVRQILTLADEESDQLRQQLSDCQRDKERLDWLLEFAYNLPCNRNRDAIDAAMKSTEEKK